MGQEFLPFFFETEMYRGTKRSKGGVVHRPLMTTPNHQHLRAGFQYFHRKILQGFVQKIIFASPRCGYQRVQASGPGGAVSGFVHSGTRREARRKVVYP